MTRQRIEHATTYLYRRAVSFGRHRLVLRPRESHDLHVESMSLQIYPAHRLVWARDVYSNSVAIVDFTADADRLEVHSKVIVRRSLPFPPQEPHEPWSIAWPVTYDDREGPVTAAYGTLSYPADGSLVKQWLAEYTSVTATDDAETLLLNLCHHVHAKIGYQRREARGVQGPAETLRLQSGSCRDMAVLMIDAARVLGLAARFVSGYLDCPAAEAGRAAMHAWAEIYLPVLGWRGYDPTIGELASLKHIPVGVSQHPRGVMPITGNFHGDSNAYINMTAPVKVERLEE